MKNILCNLTDEELIKEIEKLLEMKKHLGDVVKVMNYQTPELKEMYNKIKAEKPTAFSDIKEGNYYFIEQIHKNDDNIDIDMPPSLFVCKKKRYESKKGYGEVLWKNKKNSPKCADFKNIWVTSDDREIFFDKKNLIYYSSKSDPEIHGDYTLYENLQDRNNDYIVPGSVYLVDKKDANNFYMKFLQNARQEMDKLTDIYQKFLYVYLKLEVLQEELYDRNKKRILSSSDVYGNELFNVKKEYFKKN